MAHFEEQNVFGNICPAYKLDQNLPNQNFPQDFPISNLLRNLKFLNTSLLITEIVNLDLEGTFPSHQALWCTRFFKTSSQKGRECVAASAGSVSPEILRWTDPMIEENSVSISSQFAAADSVVGSLSCDREYSF